jgi:hypothetical protein
MPNGGYPMHLLTPIGDSGISIMVSGQQVTLQQRVEPESDSTHPHQPQFKKYGALTPDQTGKLPHHDPPQCVCSVGVGNCDQRYIGETHI